MVTDPIANYLTNIRNAIQAGHRFVSIPYSNIKKEITQILQDQGYIQNYQVEKKDSPQGTIKIALKYNPQTKESAILHIKRISKPGLRKYTNANDIPDVLSGLGIAVISTSQGIMTNKEARKKNIGGEIICYIY